MTTKEEALELIKAKIVIAKSLVKEAEELAQEMGIALEVSLSSDVDGEQTNGNWVTSNMNC